VVPRHPLRQLERAPLRHSLAARRQQGVADSADDVGSEGVAKRAEDAPFVRRVSHLHPLDCRRMYSRAAAGSFARASQDAWRRGLNLSRRAEGHVACSVLATAWTCTSSCSRTPRANSTMPRGRHSILHTICGAACSMIKKR
jgi:hypothetical protein